MTHIIHIFRTEISPFSNSFKTNVTKFNSNLRLLLDKFINAVRGDTVFILRQKHTFRFISFWLKSHPDKSLSKLLDLTKDFNEKFS